MTALLRAAAQQGRAADYARHLLAADNAKARRAPIQRGLVEPLSERELQVLRLLRTDLSGPDIARELTVSLNTIRTHTKSIYAKLERKQPPGSRPQSRRTRPLGTHRVDRSDLPIRRGLRV